MVMRSCPTDDEVEAVGIAMVKAVLRIVARAADRTTLEVDDEPAMIHALAEAAAIAPPTARPRDDRRGDDARTEAPRKRAAALIQTELGVFSIHAGTSVAAGDRAGLERQGACPCRCLGDKRYGGRPPLSHERLSITATGKVCYRLRKSYYTGQTEVVLEPVAFLRRLAALVPPARQNQIRYYGLLAAQAHDRDRFLALVPNAGGDPGTGDAGTEVVTLHGLVRYHVFFVIDLASRHVHIGGIVQQPTGAWMMQVARNLLDVEDGFLAAKTHLIMDRDPLFTLCSTIASL